MPTCSTPTTRIPETPQALGLQTVPETISPISLKLTGHLPPYLSHSTLYRNGPGRFEAPYSDNTQSKTHHWFDGFALLHAFTLDASANTVTYRSRTTANPLLRAVATSTARRDGRYSFGVDPCQTVLGNLAQTLFTSPPVDPQTGVVPYNGNVTLQNVPGKGPLVARSDHSGNLVIDPNTLEVVEPFRFRTLHNSLSGAFSAAHGHFDKDTGEFINFNFDFSGRGDVTYNIFRVEKTGETEIFASFRERPRYLHSFATTENYVIMILWPLFVDPIRIIWTRSVAASLSFDAAARTKFVVISRAERRVVGEYDGPAFFAFHIINAFEDGDDVHIDLCQYDDASVIEELTLDHLFSSSDVSPSRVARFSLDGVSADGDAREVRESVLWDRPFELPTVHPGRERKAHRFAYGLSNTPGELFNLVAKLDVREKTAVTWSAGHGVAGEPIFVPDPDGKGEDDGVLLVVVLDCDRRGSDLVVLDARDLTEVARAYVPKVVPLGFHGKFDYTEEE